MKNIDGKVVDLDSIQGEIKSIVSALKDKKGEDISVYDLRGRSSITEYAILVTAASEPHAKALKDNLDLVTQVKGINIIGNEDTLP